MLGKALSRGKKQTPSTVSNDRANGPTTGILSGSIADMLSVSGRISLSLLQKIYLVCEKEAFVEFMQQPVLVGSAILLGTLRAPAPSQTTEKNRTAVFELIDTSEDTTSVSESLQKAVYPLVKNTFAPAATSLFFIGRVDGNDIIMPDVALSKRHAAIEVKNGTYRLRDCGSTNGTMLNGQRLDQTPRPLGDGDVISLARYEFTFLFPASLYDKLRTS